MGGSIPDWITKEMLTEVLQKSGGKEDAVVTHFSASLAVPPGNNFGSTVIRLKVTYQIPHQDQLNQISLILKAELTQGALKEIFDFTSGEPSFYYRFIPEAKREMDMSFIPKTYFAPRKNDIILEDLKEEGFRMADRVKQLDYDHCRLYMIAAAKLHASSVAVFKRRPELTELFAKEKIFSNHAEEMFKILIKYAMEIFLKETNKIERFKKYTKVIEDSIPDLWEMIVRAHEPHEGLKTINQGDPWTTNMMFKYDEHGNAVDIKLLDFQCLRYATPVNDIVFFVWTSANNEVKKHKLTELYNTYLNTLNNQLEKLNCPERLTYDEFISKVGILSPEALHWAAGPCISSPEPMDFGMIQRFQESGDDQDLKTFFRNLYSEEYCSNQLPSLLESLEVNGIFEYFQNIKNVS